MTRQRTGEKTGRVSTVVMTGQAAQEAVAAVVAVGEGAEPLDRRIVAQIDQGQVVRNAQPAVQQVWQNG